MGIKSLIMLLFILEFHFSLRVKLDTDKLLLFLIV